MSVGKDVATDPGQLGSGPVYGVLELNLRTAITIAELVPAGDGATLVCRNSTWMARAYLQVRLGKRLLFQVLDRDPYYLPAQEMCDEHRRSFRCDAIESVIATGRLIVNAIGEELEATLAATGLQEVDDIFRRFLRHQAGDMVREQVYLGYHLLSRWRTNANSQAVLLLPKCWWSTHVTTVFEDTGLDIRKAPAKSAASRMASFVVRRLMRRPKPAKVYIEVSSFQVGQDDSKRNLDDEWLSLRQNKWRGVRASGIALDGLDARLRNNLGWAWCSDLPLDALVAFWAVKSRPASAWERGIGQLGMHIVSMLPEEQGQLACDARLVSPNRQQRFVRLFRGFIQVVLHRPKIVFPAKGRWLAANLAILLARSIHWQDIFSRMNVQVHIEFDYGVEAYARAFAMRKLGGIVVLDQRSHYYDNYDHTSDRQGDLVFLSGPFSLRYYTPRLFEVGGIVMTGLSRDGGDIAPPAGSPVKTREVPTVAVLDEPGTLYGPEHATGFVSSMIEHCARRGSYQIVMKPKRKDELIDKLPISVAETLNKLIDAGRAHVMASSTPVASVCEASDIVVSVPSTAAYIAIGVGKPVLVFNPFHTIRTAFYEHGLDGSHIFVDLDVMLARLDTLLANRQFGARALESMRKALDPWLDMNGNERKGYFVTKLVRHMSGGLQKSQAIEKTIADYRQRYGASACGDWQLVWDGAADYAGDLATSPPRYDRPGQFFQAAT